MSSSATSPTHAPTVTIGHTRADGTSVQGTRRGDGAAPILKRHGFRWSRALGRWIVYHSRHKPADRYRINACADDLRRGGFTVELSIDEDVRRSFADTEAEQHERAKARADRYAVRAERAAKRADGAYAASRRITGSYPLGQPILVGHHSEGRHRRDLERADRLMRRAIDEGRRAAHWAGRARAAESRQRHREHVPTTLRRLDKLEAEKRIYERALSGDITRAWDPANADQRAELQRRLIELDEQITHWRAHVEAAEAEGAKIWGPADFSKGDYVLFQGTYFEVIRVNKKSLTIPAMLSGMGIVSAGDSRLSWTDRIAYNEVSGRATPEQARAAIEDAQRQVAPPCSGG